jgi:hypothetical protein
LQVTPSKRLDSPLHVNEGENLLLQQQKIACLLFYTNFMQIWARMQWMNNTNLKYSKS